PSPAAQGGRGRRAQPLPFPKSATASVASGVIPPESAFAADQDAAGAIESAPGRVGSQFPGGCAEMSVRDLKGKTIAFAASGGLAGCPITRWLPDRGVGFVCLTADMAQPDEPDLDAIRQRMLACGAVDFATLPLRDAIAEAGLDAVQSQSCYEGRYWNT